MLDWDDLHSFLAIARHGSLSAAARAMGVRQTTMGRRLEERLTERFGNHRHVGDVRGRGLFWAIELVADRASKAVFDPALKLHEQIKLAAVRHGVAVYPMGGTVDGKRGDHVVIAPAYIADPQHLDAIVDRLGAAVDEVLARL